MRERKKDNVERNLEKQSLFATSSVDETVSDKPVK